MNGEKRGWFVSYRASRKGYERSMHVTKVIAFDEAGAKDALMRHVVDVLTPELGMYDVEILGVKGGTKQ